jgi:hypothetical protein
MMAGPFRSRGLIVVVLMLAACLSNQSRAAAALALTADGWHSWRVASVTQHDEETIVVLIKSGKPAEIDVAGHWCKQRRPENVIDHGLVSADTSIDWLQQHLGDPPDIGGHALAAISRHAGHRALQILIDIVESDAAADTRREAIFWMAMSESDAAFDYIDRLLMAD